MLGEAKMLISEHLTCKLPAVKWIGDRQEVGDSLVAPLALKNATKISVYKKCIFGELTLSPGDYVLVSNADAPDPDSLSGCDIARIVLLYEFHGLFDKDPYRAVVQWYSRPSSIPHREFDDDNICIDFEKELVEDYRPYDPDISLETIFDKCNVVCGSHTKSAETLLQQAKQIRSNRPMFVCRYKFIKLKKKNYQLVPLEVCYAVDQTPSENLRAAPRRKNSESERKADKDADAQKRRRVSVAAANAVEFIDMNYFCQDKVSPIKIIGGRSVVRLTASNKKNKAGSAETSSNQAASPLTEYNVKVTPTSRLAAARRNLNHSLNSEADKTRDSDCLNYSIVKERVDTNESSNEIKIKLRVSEKRRSSRPVSIDDDPLYLGTNASILQAADRKRLGTTTEATPQNSDIYHTPSKKAKDSGGVSEMTPSIRRKSILKSASRPMTDGTPKRSIKLSDIVEKRIFQDDDIICTPKSIHPRGRKMIDPNYEEMTTPKKSQQNKSTRRRTINPKTSSPHHAERTPTQKLKLIRSGEISPSIGQRKAASANKHKSDLQLAREQLHVSVIPQSLPCREKEFDNIFTFIEGKIQDQCGGCMYVSGVPGTGKTATVTGVIRALKAEVARDQLPAFDYLEINGMRLTEPRQAYVQIYKQLTDKTVSWEHAHSLLEKRFTTPAPRRKTTVLLVDELDILCNRRQDVVYNLLDWPTKSAAQLVVVTIANTMDLPERLLMGKVTSRLGLTRLTFQPYNHKQLQDIVAARLIGIEAFKGEAVQLVARKVAAVSGDARRALDICRRATEIADVSVSRKQTSSQNHCVNMSHVQHALEEMIASAKVQAIKNCSRLEQIFLQAVVAEVTRTGVEETTFMGVYAQIETIASFTGVAVPAPGRALRLCAKLGSERLLICEHSRTDIFQKILLNVSVDDIHYALRVNGIA